MYGREGQEIRGEKEGKKGKEKEFFLKLKLGSDGMGSKADEPSDGSTARFIKCWVEEPHRSTIRIK